MEPKPINECFPKWSLCFDSIDMAFSFCCYFLLFFYLYFLEYILKLSIVPYEAFYMPLADKLSCNRFSADVNAKC